MFCSFNHKFSLFSDILKNHVYYVHHELDLIILFFSFQKKNRQIADDIYQIVEIDENFELNWKGGRGFTPQKWQIKHKFAIYCRQHTNIYGKNNSYFFNQKVPKVLSTCYIHLHIAP